MPYLIELLLFCAPIGIFLLWRRARPSAEPGWGTLGAAVIGLLLALAGGVWFGRLHSIDRDSVYVPAQLQGDRILPGHTEPRR